MVVVVVGVVADNGKAKLSGRREKDERVKTVFGEKKRVETRRRAARSLVTDGSNVAAVLYCTVLLCYYVT